MSSGVSAIILSTDFGNFFQLKRVEFWDDSANIVLVEIEPFTEV